MAMVVFTFAGWLIACYWIGEDEMLKFGCRPRRPWAADLQWLAWFTVGRSSFLQWVLLGGCSELTGETVVMAAKYSARESPRARISRCIILGKDGDIVAKSPSGNNDGG